MGTPRHKVFISYYHADDQAYKDKLIQMKEYDISRNQIVSIFDNYSVNEDEIDDTNMTDEQIRCEIRDNYIKNATVLILLCGENTRKRKHIDWEIHAAMYDSDYNPKMGILVINVDGGNRQIACGKEEENIIAPFTNWVQLNKDIATLKQDYPNLPDRIIANIARSDVSITVVNWNNICDDTNKIKRLIDSAYQRRENNKYDHSAPLRRKNSK
jgi:hypothetical protein